MCEGRRPVSATFSIVLYLKGGGVNKCSNEGTREVGDSSLFKTRRLGDLATWRPGDLSKEIRH